MRKKLTFNHVTLLSALSISGVAIFYSVAGLISIFAAYAVSVSIMGTTIELGKLVTAVWLHRNWKKKVGWVKWYLAGAMFVMMFITSMGIFGYLSKAHIEQASTSAQNLAEITRVDDQIASDNATISLANQRIKQYETSGGGADAAINSQIDREQKRIDNAYNQVKPLIQTQRDVITAEQKKIDQTIQPYQDEADQIRKDKKAVDDALGAGKVKTAQRLIGAHDDGTYGTKTIDALKAYRARKDKRLRYLQYKIQQIKKQPDPAIDAAQKEIDRINASVQDSIAQSNKTITQLRGRLGQDNAGNVEKLIEEQQAKIKVANSELDTLTKKKFELKTVSRKLEADVGPIKYIAEFIYGNHATDDLLQNAVRWVIVLIILVFDPLAVGLLIAAQHGFDAYREEHPEEKQDFIEDAFDVMFPSKKEVVEPEPKVEPELELDDEEKKDLENFDYNFAKGLVIPEEPEHVDEQPYINEELNIPTLKQEYKEPWSNLNELDEINRAHLNGKQAIMMTKVADNYINYNGKVYSVGALTHSFPHLNLNFGEEVSIGEAFPDFPDTGDMFMRLDSNPTTLYIFNGRCWDKIDKNVLEPSAYSKKYIEALVGLLGSGQYNPELLNKTEAKHIETMLTQGD